jgi:hypothetical protein
VLGGLELPQVQRIVVDEDQVFARHQVASLEGDFLLGLARRASRLMLAGVLTGSEAGQGLRDLRERFRAAEPVQFTADIATATRVDQVLIQELTIRELAGKPERYEYEVTLRQYLPPPQPQTEAPPPPADVDDAARRDAQQATAQQVDQTAAGVGGLDVQVANPTGDYSALAVLVQGSADSGERLSFTLLEQQNGVYRRDDVPAGTYLVSVVRRAGP